MWLASIARTRLARVIKVRSCMRQQTVGKEHKRHCAHANWINCTSSIRHVCISKLPLNSVNVMTQTLLETMPRIWPERHVCMSKLPLNSINVITRTLIKSIPRTWSLRHVCISRLLLNSIRVITQTLRNGTNFAYMTGASCMHKQNAF